MRAGCSHGRAGEGCCCCGGLVVRGESACQSSAQGWERLKKGVDIDSALLVGLAGARLSHLKNGRLQLCHRTDDVTAPATAGGLCREVRRRRTCRKRGIPGGSGARGDVPLRRLSVWQSGTDGSRLTRPAALARAQKRAPRTGLDTTFRPRVQSRPAPKSLGRESGRHCAEPAAAGKRHQSCPAAQAVVGQTRYLPTASLASRTCQRSLRKHEPSSLLPSAAVRGVVGSRQPILRS